MSHPIKIKVEHWLVCVSMLYHRVTGSLQHSSSCSTCLSGLPPFLPSFPLCFSSSLGFSCSAGGEPRPSSTPLPQEEAAVGEEPPRLTNVLYGKGADVLVNACSGPSATPKSIRKQRDAALPLHPPPQYDHFFTSFKPALVKPDNSHSYHHSG